MFSIKTRILAASVLLILLVPIAYGQQATTQPAPTARTPEYVEEKGFKARVFEVRNRDPRTLLQPLQLLGSGFKGASISYSEEFKTITVRDFPENIVTIEEALKRLDTPQAPTRDIELRIHVLVASNVEGGNSPVPSELNDVVRQLQTTLSYKNYYLVTSIVQRVKEGARRISGIGVAQVGVPLVKETVDAPYDYSLDTVSITSNPAGASTVQIREFRFNMNPHNVMPVSALLGRAHIGSDLGVREGEKVVVGTATLKDKAMILVVSTKVIK